MGNDQKLRFLGHLAHIACVAIDVRIVQGGLDLVHHAKGRRTNLEDRKVQGDGDKSHLTAGQEADIGKRLAGGLHLDLNAAVEHVVFVLEPQRRLAAAEEIQEGLAEAGVDLLEAFDKDLLHLACDVPDDIQQLRLGLVHVGALLREKFIAGIHALIFLDRAEVRRAEGVDLPAQLGHGLACFQNALHRLALGLRGGMAQLIVLPELV